MIDAHAKSELSAAVEYRNFGGAHLTQEAVDVLRHALQAIEDRKALVDSIGSNCTLGAREEALVSSLHMRGEP